LGAFPSSRRVALALPLGFSQTANAAERTIEDQSLNLPGVDRWDLLQNLTVAEQREVLNGAIGQTFERKEKIFREGEPIRFASVVTSGRVKMTMLSESGSEIIIRVLCDGHGLSVGPFCRGVHSLTSQALESSHVLSWKIDVFEQLTARFPMLHHNIGKIIERRIHQLEARYLELATEPVPARLSRLLLRLAQESGTPEADGFRIGLSREELGQLSGTTLFTVSRLVNEWSQLGYVQPQREAIVIRNACGLKSIAGA
jgi:CRP-like cAMP-binding protein